jgi:4-amino-4-deoxy-L-arabinose transferase-like glycosyltransferase
MSSEPPTPPPTPPGATPSGAERLLLAALLLVTLALLVDLPRTFGLVEPDEGRYTDIPATMLRSGDWITPRLDGVRYFEKPPMLYWLGAVSMKLFGVAELPARLPSRLAFLATAFLVFLAGRRWGGGRFAGLLASLFYLAMPLPAVLGRIVSIDTVLTLGCTAALFLVALGIERFGEERRLTLLEATGLGAALAFGILAKGPIALVLAAGAFGLWWILFSRKWGSIAALRPVTTTLVMLLLTTPWFVAVSLRNPDFPRFFFIHEHLARYTTTVHKRDEPFGVLIGVLLAGLLPWTGTALAAAWKAFRGRSEEGPGATPRSVERFLVLAGLFPLLFFSISKSQLPTYVLPCIAPLAVVAAGRIARELERGEWGRLVASAATSFGLGALLVIASLAGRLDPGGRNSGTLVDLALPGLVWIAAGLAGLRAPVAPRMRAALLAALAALGVPALFPATEEALESRTSSHYSRDIARLVDPDDIVVGYRIHLWSLPIFLGRPVRLVEYRNEMAYGCSYPDAADVAWDLPTLRRVWNEPRRVVVLMQAKHLKHFLSEGFAPVYPHYDVDYGLMLLSNRPSRFGAVAIDPSAVALQENPRP